MGLQVLKRVGLGVEGVVLSLQEGLLSRLALPRGPYLDALELFGQWERQRLLALRLPQLAQVLHSVVRRT